MRIRPENPSDFTAIYDLVKTAFETAEVKDGSEQDLVNILRADSSKYIPELALVAEQNGIIVGYIMLTRTWVQNDQSRHEVLYLAPVAVALEHRRQGIGSELIRTAMQKGKQMGFTSVFLAGNPAYYNRFGFVPTIRHNIKCNVDIPEELYPNIMTCELYPNALNGISGIVQFDTGHE
jgi:predicted N-acetyltransferase YhbS